MYMCMLYTHSGMLISKVNGMLIVFGKGSRCHSIPMLVICRYGTVRVVLNSIILFGLAI